MQIRDFDDRDWDSFWPTFRSVTQAGETFPYDPHWTSDEAKGVWTSPDHVVVATDGPVVLGSATVGANRPGPGSHVATASFMVAPEARGRGVGRALGVYVVDWARRQGYAAMQFNAVVETNDPAVHLWESIGFEVIGTVPAAFEHPVHGRVGLHIMHRVL